MSKVKFTPEQQQMLRENPYTIHVTADVLSISKEFKEIFYIARNTASEIYNDLLTFYYNFFPCPKILCVIQQLFE